MIHEMYLPPSRHKALAAYEDFRIASAAKYPPAWKCLEKDQERLFTFYNFPAEHWVHLRTTNPIESTFATVRLRTVRTKRCGSRSATLSMVFKLAQRAQKTWAQTQQSRLTAASSSRRALRGRHRANPSNHQPKCPHQITQTLSEIVRFFRLLPVVAKASAC
jgi:transposase-like protein